LYVLNFEVKAEHENARNIFPVKKCRSNAGIATFLL
jgi:hypothetical protein